MAVARYQLEQTPSDDALSEHVAEITAALATQEQAITVAREAQKDMSNAFLDLLHEIRHLSSPNVPLNATVSIRLSAPKPFCMGNDFAIFSELFGSYVANKPFDIQLQVLKTSLSAEVYRVGRSAIIGTHRHNLGLVLEDLRVLIAPKPTLASLLSSSSGFNPTSGGVAGADLASPLAPVQRIALFHSHSLQIFLDAVFPTSLQYASPSPNYKLPHSSSNMALFHLTTCPQPS